jgi:GDP-4-dehydro-6-deoxy-D-mannose reductase
VLVTGDAGFAGTHLCRALRQAGHEVSGFDARAGDDVRDYEAVRAAVEDSEPDRVYHLAAAAWPGESMADPGRVMDVNTGGTLNLLQALRATGSEARVLLAGTSEEYGYEWPAGTTLTEDSPARPTTPYGVSKLAATHLGMVYARRWGLPVVVTRAFNHTGHGRQAVNAESAFARRIVAAERGQASHVAHGDLSARRNFSHVLDVIAAYQVAIEQPPGIYNVASPGSVSLGDVMGLLLSLSAVPGIPLKQDPRFPRTDQPAEFPAVDAGKLAAAGWAPEHTLEEALADVLDYWRSR